ncbi:ribosomal protein subunit YmL33 [Schizosaccharomyces japonicus yFS275]|uniref:Large ribosomal subunit protein uL30m n=1 Tax=Schizosaccharomyces japonicus (strain yFS275 / FY16936) TaxID=402676 RepID=T0TB38_SCHJY|nr:ribosomal protein subunit YmL33 [Schizosaccharomyces japonicus yFS275]EQC53043.1 ribosomal protein subunit YmL33 [Schizosaccharomyces japonicus yFS275]
MPAKKCFRVVQQRSCIGMPSKLRAIARSLGLGKVHSVSYPNINPGVAGKILRIKELVSVTTVEKPVSRAQEHSLRSPTPGFTVISSFKDSLQKRI